MISHINCRYSVKVKLYVMENYYKGKNIEEDLDRSKVPFENLPDSFLWMQVKGGSKMANLLSHASGILEDNAATAVVWSGAGVAISKAISCAEILKRQIMIKHQITKLVYKKVEEYWEPKLDGLETIVVKRQIPVIHILLSNDETLANSAIGYQSISGSKLWKTNNANKNVNTQQSKKPFKHKKTFVKS